MRTGLLSAPTPYTFTRHTMLQRSKSAGKQTNRPGYVPLPATDEQASGSRDRNKSPLPESLQKRGTGAAKPGAKPVGKRMIAPGQPAPGARSKEKFVSLPDELEELELPPPLLEVPPALFEDIDISERISQAPKQRISIYCIAESLDRKLLEKRLEARGPSWLVSKYPDVLYGQYTSLENPNPTGSVFYFDYGCVSFWNLTPKQEQDILKNIVVPCELNPLPVREVEIDEFDVRYTANEKMNIQNDTITLNYRLSGDHSIKLSISYALSQSTKLCVYEERVLEIVQSTKDLPESLAETGKVSMSRKAIAQLIGKVFIQRAAVNLLSTVLDTPEFFWSAPDIMQTLYKRICEYMELDDRVEVLNNRFAVLSDMLELVRDHAENAHSSYLEWIVIILVAICVFVGIFEVMGTVGLVLQDLLNMIREHQNTGHTARLEWIVIILIAVEIVIGIFESISILGWVGTAG